MPRIINIKDKDFGDLANEITMHYIDDGVFVDPNELVGRMKNKTPEQRYNEFVRLMDLYPRAWEFVSFYKDRNAPEEVENKRFKDMAEQVLPTHIRNSGDSAVIEDYLQNTKDINIRGKAILIKRLIALDKIAENERLAQARENGQEPFNDRPKLDVKRNGERFVLEVDMPREQTSFFGCWSCGGQMLLQGRGIKNVRQEDIRAYRPKYPVNQLMGPKFQTSATIDRAFNSDDMQNVMDMGDALLKFAPDSMLRTLDILRIREAELTIGRQFTPQEKEAYKRNAINLVKKTLRKAIMVDKSPVTISDGGHYITIVGMDGDDILFKTSSGSMYQNRYKKKLSDMVHNMLYGNYKMQFVWMNDIQLAQDHKTFYNVPSNTLSLKEDGSLNMPPGVIQYDADSMKAEQEYDGFRTRLYAGKETTAADRIGTNIMVDGVIKIEQCYFPKKVNAKRLKTMADRRKPEEEQRLRNETTVLLGYDPVEANKEKKQSRDLDSVRLAPTLDKVDTKSKYKTDDDFENDLNRKTRLDNKNQRFFDRKLVDLDERKKEKNNQIEERFNQVSASIGKNNPFFTTEKDVNGKEFIWNKEGAVTAFRLQLAYNAIIPVLQKLGKAEKVAELKQRYDELMNKMNSPENAITAEEGANLSGWNGNGVTLPNGQINMTHYFKNKEDIYEASMLLQSITGSISITQDLKLLRPDHVDYKPSILSTCLENIQTIGDYSKGNILKACGKSPYLYNVIKKSTTLPNYELDELNVTLNNANPKLQNYIFHNRVMFQALSNEYKVQGLDNEAGIVNPNSIYPITDGYQRTGRTIIGTYNKMVKSDPSQKDNNLEPLLAFMNGEAKALVNGWTLSEKNILGFIIAIDAEIYACETSGVKINPEMKREFEGLFKGVKTLKVDDSKFLSKQNIVRVLYSLCSKYINEIGMQFVRDNKMLLDDVCSQFVNIKDYDFSKVDEMNIIRDDKTDDIKIEIKADEIKVEDSEPKKTEDEKPAVDPEAIRKLEEAFAALQLETQEIQAKQEKQNNQDNQAKPENKDKKAPEIKIPELRPTDLIFTDDEIMSDEELQKEFDAEFKIVDEEMRKAEDETLDKSNRYVSAQSSKDDGVTLEEFLASVNANQQQNQNEDQDEVDEVNQEELPPYKRFDDYDQVVKEDIYDDAAAALVSFGNNISYGNGETFSMTKDFVELTTISENSIIQQTYNIPYSTEKYGKFIKPEVGSYALKPVTNRNAFKRYKMRLENVANDMDELIDSKLENGEIGHDAAMYSKAFTSNAIRRTIKGFGYHYISSKTPLGFGIKAMDGALNPVVDEDLDKKIKKWRDKFPVHDLVIEGSNQLDHLADYWSLKEQGKMTPEIEKLYRETLYSETLRMQRMIDKIETAIEDPKTNAEIRKDVVMSPDTAPDHIHSAAARGIKLLAASTDAYKIGIENGWTIDDIGILAMFNHIRINAITKVKYDENKTDKVQLREKPEFINEEHKAFLEKMDSFYNKIKKTPLKSAETRKKILNQMSKMVNEMKDKNFCAGDEKNILYYNQLDYNIRKRDVLIEAGAEKAFHEDELEKSLDRDQELNLFLVDFNKKRTDLYIGKESDEHKNLRVSVESVVRVRENIYAEDAGDELSMADVELYFNALDEAIYNSKVYQKEKKNPGTDAGKDRLKGSIKMEKLFREERNKLLTFAKNEQVTYSADSIEEFRLSLAEDRSANSYNDMILKVNMPTTEAAKMEFMGMAADIMVYKFGTSESEANKKAFHTMGINNLKKEIMNNSEFKTLMKNYFRDRTMTPKRLAQELDGNEALLRMRDMNRKFRTAETKVKQRAEKIEEKLKNNKIQM